MIVSIVTLIAVLSVLAVLGWGLLNMLVKDKPVRRQRSNRLMQLRVALQIVAVALIFFVGYLST